MGNIKTNPSWTSRGENYNVWSKKYLNKIHSRLDIPRENISILGSIVIETIQRETLRKK